MPPKPIRPPRNSGLDRRWIQTDGLPLPPVLAAVRAEIDRVTHVETLPGSSRLILYGPTADGKAIGPVIGALDLVPDPKARIDDAAYAGIEQAEAEKPSDDTTTIVPFDPNDPRHRAALDGAVVYNSSGHAEARKQAEQRKQAPAAKGSAENPITRLELTGFLVGLLSVIAAAAAIGGQLGAH